MDQSRVSPVAVTYLGPRVTPENEESREISPYVQSQTAPRNVWTPAVAYAIDAVVILCVFLFLGLGTSSLSVLSTVVFTVLTQIAFAVASVYSNRTWTRAQVVYEIVKGSFLGFVILGFADFAITPLAATPRILAEGLAGSALFLAGWRLLLFEKALRQDHLRILVIASEGALTFLQKELANFSKKNYEFIGTKAAVLNDDLATVSLITNAVPNLVVLDKHVFPALRHKTILTYCLENDIAVHSMSTACEILTGRIPVETIDDRWVLSCTGQENRKAYVFAKRALDVVVASLGIFITALIFPIIALLIVADGPGPVIYSQVRIGLRGREFRIYKFRTMRNDAEREGAVWAKENDERITSIGRFLRQTRLDELPQFWNVIQGEMSIVGPRPERPEFVSKLAEEIPHFDYRHFVLPGVTGWAQVNFPYGASIQDSVEKLQFDLYYLKNSSFFLDLQIMFKTIFVMINKLGGR